MRFQILGHLEARDGDRSHHLGAPMQRSLLAHLLLAAGRPLPADELVDRLWNGAAPERATGTLQVHVLKLRRVLTATGCAARIETCARSYRLDLGSDELDALDFQTATALASRAAEAGDALGEVETLDAALALWRDDILVGLAGDWPRYPEVRRLSELRSTARQQLARAHLVGHRPVAAAEQLRALVACHPDRERLRYLLVLALHRAGRRAEALAAYDEAYRFAADHLGLEPDSTFRRLQRAVLDGEPIDEPGHARPQPCALPARLGTFVGRQDALADLTAALAADTTTCVITGMPGVGKSAVALRLAHAVREDFPDGQLHAELGEHTDPSTVLARFLRLLGVRDASIPDSEVERTELFRAHTASRKVLLLLDDALNATQVRPLLPGDGPSAVIVTSRVPLSVLDNAVHVRLEPLSDQESVALLAEIAGDRRIGLAPAAARLVVTRCGHLPLALRVVAAKMAARPKWPLAALADLLADDRGRLDRLACEDLSVRASFDRACRLLPDIERRAFRLLGLLGAASFTVTTAAALLDTDPNSARDVLEALVDAQLVQAAEDGYRLPDLLRLYAEEQAELLDPIGIRAKARQWLSASDWQPGGKCETSTLSG